MKRSAATSIVAGATIAAMMWSPGPVQADPGEDAAASSSSSPGSHEPAEQPADDPTVGGVSVLDGDATLTVGESAIERARDKAVDAETEEGLSNYDQALEDNLIEATEERGGSIDADDIDVVPLFGGDVSLTVPVDVEVSRVTLDIGDGDVTVTAQSDQAPGSEVATSGPGMAPYWAGDGDGDYVLTVRGMGNALFTWSRSKLMNDGDARYVWYAYRRKGDASPYDRSGGYDARVKLLRVQNFPFDSIERDLVNWNEWDPASDFSGNCDGRTYNAGVSVGGANIGIAFQDCDGYEVWRNASKPSSYWIEMDQGQYLRGGSRQAGYTLAWKQNQGTAGSQHDLQKVTFRLNGDATTCQQTDAGRTCG